MRTKFRSAADEVYFFFGLSVLSGGYTELPLRVAAPRMELGDSNPFNTVAMFALLFGLIALAGSEWRRVLTHARQAPAVICYVALAALSILWSFDPMVTMRRSVTLGIGVGFGVYAATRFPMEGIIRRAAIVSAVLALSSTFVALALPRYGVMSEGELAGRWNGVFPHKQQLGQAMFLGILTFAWLFARAGGWRDRMGLAAAIVFSFFVLIMARSETATVSVLAIPGMYAFMRACAMPGVARLWAIYAFAVVLIAAITLLATDAGAIMGLFGRDASLTGRAPLWALLMEVIARDPIFGQGYGAFWLATNPISIQVNAISGWYVPEAHNGYIDLMLQTGLPGFLLAIVMLFGTIRLSCAAAAANVSWASWAGAFTIIVAITNIAETMIFRTGDVQCELLPLFYVALRSWRVGLVVTEEASREHTGSPGFGPAWGATENL